MRRTRTAAQLVAWTAVGALGLAGVAVAAEARTPRSSQATLSSSSAAAGAPDASSSAPGRPDRSGHPGRHGFGHHRGPGRIAMRALHGEAVVPKGSGFETLAFQRGAVTSVSATAISLKSDDGYTATYVIASSTKTRGLDKVTDLKAGDVVGVVAVKSGSDLTARTVVRRPAHPGHPGKARPAGADDAGSDEAAADEAVFEI